MLFDFATAARILFGEGRLNEIGSQASAFGQRALVVASSAGRAAPLLERLHTAQVQTTLYNIAQEPTIALALAGAEAARQADAHMVIAFGGGSALDSGKAIAALATNPGDPLDYLEVIGRGQPLRFAPLPVIAIPTTAGTGSEVTSNAVLSSPEQRVKVSLRSPLMLPRIALVDPELTRDLPPEITASTGLDALTQVIEPYVSNKANPITDGLCLEGIRRAGGALRRAVMNGQVDSAARHDMALASLLGGLALANAKLGAVHGFAAPIGGMFAAPHGAVCAALLPVATEINIRALRQRAPDHEALRRYREIGRLLAGAETAGTLHTRDAADALVRWLYTLTHDLRIPPLRAYGLTPDHIPDVVSKAAVASSMKGNPIDLSHDELSELLRRAL